MVVTKLKLKQLVAGDVTGPAGAGNGNIAVFDGITGKIIKDGGAPAGGGDVYGDVGATDGHLAVFDGDGYHIKDGGVIGGILTYPCDGRLTLESGVPISMSDQVDKTTLYFTPYKGDSIAVYDGASAWIAFTFAEKSLNIAAFTASKPYDIFIYDNAGTLTLEGLVWTNGTTRATALVLQNGVYVKSGATTRRYLGTIYMDAASKCQDSEQQRFVWNYYNRIQRLGKTWNTTASWTYGTASWREYNNGTGNVRHEYITGLAEELVRLLPQFVCNPVAGGSAYCGMKIDATNGADIQQQFLEHSGMGIFTYLTSHPGTLVESIGYHYCTMVDYSTGANSTFYGGTGRKSQILRFM